MPKVKTSAMTGYAGSDANAYDHNTNSGINRSLAVNNGINGVMSGAGQEIKVVPINWDGLGLEESVHGQEVTKLANDIVEMSRGTWDANSYGTMTNYENNTKNTNRILDNLAATDMSGAEKQILGIVGLTKEFNKEVTAKPGFFAMIIGKGKHTIRNAREKYDTVSQRVDAILNDLNNVAEQLSNSSDAIRELDDINKKEFHATALYIAAGRMALNQLVGELQAIDMDDGVGMRTDFHMSRKLHALEKRLHDLELTQVHRKQQSPQYAIILENNDAVIDKLTSVKTTLIPAWRSGITTTLAIQNVQKSTALIEAIQNANDSYMLENSRMLRTSTAEVAKVSQRGILDINVLKEVQMNLEASMTDVIRIQNEGRIKRDAELTEIRQLQNNIDKIAITEIGNTIKRVTEDSGHQMVDIEKRVEQA